MRIELLLKVPPSADYNAIQDGDQVTYVSKQGRAVGKVVMKPSQQGFEGGAAVYLHVQFANVPSWQLEQDTNANIQVGKTMRTMPVTGYTVLSKQQ